jgi:hypothetical protein
LVKKGAGDDFYAERWVFQDYNRGIGSDWGSESAWYKRVGLAGSPSWDSSYKIFYVDNATYDLGMFGSSTFCRSLNHEQPLDGGEVDTGYLFFNKTDIGKVVRQCGAWVCFYLGDNLKVGTATFTNMYYHVWWSSTNPSATTKNHIYVNASFGSFESGSTGRYNNIYNSSSIDKIAGLSDYYGGTYYLNVGILNFTNNAGTDDTNVVLDGSMINNLAFGVSVTGVGCSFPRIMSKPDSGYHNKTWVIFNLPSNATLAGLNSDGDAYSDFDELFVLFQNPFYFDGGIPEVVLTVSSPTNSTYNTGTIPVSLSASGGTIDRIWYNFKNGSNWVFGSNKTYSVPLYESGFVNGSYTFVGWANNTGGNSDRDQVVFTVEIPAFPPVVLTITAPIATTYTSENVTVTLSASGGTIDVIWYNFKNGSNWVYITNQTYSTSIVKTGFKNGTYTFVAWANNTDGDSDREQVTFTIAIPAILVTLTITSPTNTTYTSGSVTVTLSASGGTIDKIWFNVKNGTSWVYPSNQTYATTIVKSGYINGTYVFVGWANNTLGNSDREQVIFTIAISAETETQTSFINDAYLILTITMPLLCFAFAAIAGVTGNSKAGIAFLIIGVAVGVILGFGFVFTNVLQQIP